MCVEPAVRRRRPRNAPLYLILSLTAEALAQRGGGGGVAAVAQQLRERVDRLHRLGGLRAERLSLQRVGVHCRCLRRAPLLREQ